MERVVNIIQYLERSAAAHPDRPALEELGRTLSYRETQTVSQCIGAAVLRALDGQIRRQIGVFLPKGIDAVCADYGALYAGSYFLNIDIKAPQQRNSNILARLKPPLILTSRRLEAQLQEIASGATLVFLEEIDTGCIPAPESLPWPQITDADPFCVITTSGSTGTPKGVVLPHRGYIDHLTDKLNAMSLHRSVRLASIAPTDFDFFVYEITMILVNASTMVLMPDSYLMFPLKLVRYLCESKVDYLMWVASYMVTIAQYDLFSKFAPVCLRDVWFGGEVFPTKYLNYWRRHLPGARFVHCYGPTEASFACTYKIIGREYPDEEQLPIGKPFQNTRILVLDEQNRPVGAGGEGELCVLGSRLALGYYNDPEKTALAFTQNPTNSTYPEPMYRTGDIVKVLDDGDLLFRGRADTLIKHLGYRIELGEVEHVINALGIVYYACAAYNRDLQEITLFYEAERELTVAEMRAKIGTALPKYMIPTAFVYMERLPRNTNDKIDRVALKGLLVKTRP